MSLDQRTGQLVDRRVQLALARRIVLHWCVFVLSSGMLAMFSRFVQSPFTGWQDCLRGFCDDQLPFLVVAILLLPIFVFDTVKLTHRFSGPMVRFRRAIRDVTENRTTAPLIFRPGDFWHDIAVNFNKLLDHLDRHRLQQATHQETPTHPERVCTETHSSENYNTEHIRSENSSIGISVTESIHADSDEESPLAKAEL